jgi:hypothetical protein
MICNHGVAGSSPAAGTNHIKACVSRTQAFFLARSRRIGQPGNKPALPGSNSYRSDAKGTRDESGVCPCVPNARIIIRQETAMQHTLAAVFDKQSQAQKALEDLVASGFPRDHVHLSQGDDRAEAAGHMDESEGEHSMGAGIRSFFAEIFGPGDVRGDADLYSEAVRRGNYVLTVDVDEDEAVDRATDVLDRYDPVDIDEQATQWRSGGWAAQDSMRSDQAGSFGSDADQSPVSRGKAVRSYQRNTDTAYRPTEGGMENLSGAAYAAGSESAYSDDENDVEAYYRGHWNSNFAGSHDAYEDYAPAYQYGSRIAESDRYQGRPWNDVEQDVRSDWEARNPGSAWEKFKAAIRHGWDRMTG